MHVATAFISLFGPFYPSLQIIFVYKQVICQVMQGHVVTWQKDSLAGQKKN